MFVRGSGSGLEYKRVDTGFYRGIVVKNNDPSKLNRVKIYIPELTNQPYDNWFEQYINFNLNAPGKNLTPLGEKDTGLNDTKMFEEIAALIPWAEQCSGLVGESGNFRYHKDGEISFISDCNYEEGFTVNDTEAPSLSAGSFSPAFLYENESTVLGDAFSDPVANFCVKCNPYSFSYRPSKYVNKAKGMFGVPEVGSKVWVFHYEGDLNFPVYFGVVRDYRSLTLINDTDNKEMIGPKYPADFDN